MAISSSLVSELDPCYYQHAIKGNAFLYTGPGQALLLSATTGTVPTIFNPAGSGKNFVPLAIKVSFLSGTSTIGAVLIAQTVGAGASAATAAAILTGTHVAPAPAFVGGSAASAMRHFPTTNTFTAAPTVIAATGINIGAGALGTGTYETWLNGSLVFAPGTAMSITYSVATSTSLFFTTVFGLEIPI